MVEQIGGKVEDIRKVQNKTKRTALVWSEDYVRNLGQHDSSPMRMVCLSANDDTD